MDMDIDEKFQAYLNQKGFHNFDGDRGVRRIENIAQDIGGYDSITEFLADNPAACEGLVEFIKEWIPRNSEWEDSLTKLVGYANLEDEWE